MLMVLVLVWHFGKLLLRRHLGSSLWSHRAGFQRSRLRLPWPPRSRRMNFFPLWRGGGMNPVQKRCLLSRRRQWSRSPLLRLWTRSPVFLFPHQFPLTFHPLQHLALASVVQHLSFVHDPDEVEQDVLSPRLAPLHLGRHLLLSQVSRWTAPSRSRRKFPPSALHPASLLPRARCSWTLLYVVLLLLSPLPPFRRRPQLLFRRQRSPLRGAARFRSTRPAQA
mmetsp:Transcript_2834/g.6525  ORF Transcript_2834/g.6525 Transcript_2834/m.6525 type:complete len:222 (-) Transcript_2834:3009-3674(-)